MNGLTGGPGKSQKEGHEDQETLKELGVVVPLAGPPGLPSGSSLGSLSIHQTSLSHSLFLEANHLEHLAFQNPIAKLLLAFYPPAAAGLWLSVWKG